MEKIKALFKNKKVVAGTIAVLLLAIVGMAFALNQPQTKNEVVQQETISDAEHEKLVAKMKELQEADKIAQAKAEEDKKIAEEKVKAEAEKKSEEKQKEVKEKEDAEKKTHPVQPQPEKKVQTAEKPVVDTGGTTKEEPKPVEKSKPIKYCEYNGPRKHVKNICNNGSPWADSPTGRDPNSFVVRGWVNRVNNGEIDLVVFKGETDRYHLITTPELREGLEKATDLTANCYVNGTCRGFLVP